MLRTSSLILLAVVAYSIAAISPSALAKDALPSWKEGPAKKAITDFVKKVTTSGELEFVKPSERIAVFDNDGTLWAEQPIYFQLAFAIDRVKALAPKHPEWKNKQPFKAVLDNDMDTLVKSGKRGLMELRMATHTGMSSKDFARVVEIWINGARNPKTGKLYRDMIYQPMLELLSYLRANGFKTYIVSGGGMDFMRPWAESVYGIPPDQVVGSSIKVKYEVKDGTPVITRLPELNFIDDKEGKPVGIHYHIGTRPIAAFGNSDGDFQMLEWVTAGEGPRLGVLIHHDDAEREFAYDRESHIGKLNRGLDEAEKRGWVVVSMKSDWACIFPYQCKAAASEK